jgi:hypothetical protein
MARVYLCILCGERVDVREEGGEDFVVTRVEHEDNPAEYAHLKCESERVKRRLQKARELD